MYIKYSKYLHKVVDHTLISVVFNRCIHVDNFSNLFVYYYFICKYICLILLRSIVLDSNNCQNSTTMTPLNDLLLGQTYIIETSEEPVFVNGTQVNRFDLNLFYF